MQVARAGRRAGQHAAIQEPVGSTGGVPDASSTPQASRACGQTRISPALVSSSISLHRLPASHAVLKACHRRSRQQHPPTPTCRQDLCSRPGSCSTKAHQHSGEHSRMVQAQVCPAPAQLSSNKCSSQSRTAASQLLRHHQSRGLGSAWI